MEVFSRFVSTKNLFRRIAWRAMEDNRYHTYFYFWLTLILSSIFTFLPFVLFPNFQHKDNFSRIMVCTIVSLMYNNSLLPHSLRPLVRPNPYFVLVNSLVVRLFTRNNTLLLPTNSIGAPDPTARESLY